MATWVFTVPTAICRSRANADLQKRLRNAYEYRDSLLGFVLTHFTLLGVGK
ncbi:hypothetical protein R69927_06294 [Paraburkholderia domus]|jgi:hypothetical protein|uniref:Uncharacterized protein n=1 Tax=Paraburkholderia domus TaxID=2793075 RepID=A0A9N8R263_9BURK|nr:hypothetical protein [Paraburkholderia domus]MBK5053513.1 hypothetical protein [Burkholderia sp. R-70006]MBK5063905.1 hypothetical protein [Burkholderia sp. R-70199]MBK5090321.1 hypothetical protein [Burkholderia sp. R-69927]MBK5124877.1 hypothetical protein [Burkholderia sp. R-69980]MBK5169247.1 hypothetical protein [Burkholderia sp. R-70211]MBK5185979.1 hypothetical protein [Burkholderia sp. R-69749]MCI0148775.1 hypothetical protein [Paraburkholderia sediminicola]